MIIKRNVLITPFNLKRTVHIYLPKNYRKSNDKYPVLYMYDGHNLFNDEDATYGKSWGLKSYLDSINAKLIVVGVECNHEGNERLCEYSPYNFSDTYWGRVTGRGKLFMDWLVKELKPFIDQNYRTYPDRKHTGIGGSSMGGLMAMYSIAVYNKTFAKAACISSFIYKVAPQLNKDINRKLLNPTKIYISWGGYETKNRSGLAKETFYNLEAANILMANSASVYLNQPIKGTHCEAAWEKEVPTCLDFLYTIK